MTKVRGRDGDWLEGDLFQLETRLNSTQESIRRTRFAVFVLALASFAGMVALWNTLFSVDRLSSFRSTLIADEAKMVPSVFRPDDKAVREEITKSMVDNWMDSTYVNLPVVGLKVSVSDFSFYNSTVLLFLTLYLLLSERRENREIGRLFQDVFHKRLRGGEHRFLALTVYRSVMAYMVFNLARKPDDPIESIEMDAPPKAYPQPTGNIVKVWFTKQIMELFGEGQIALLRQVVLGIFLLPIISIAVNLAYHFVFVSYSGFPWGVKRLSGIYIPVLIWECFCLIYVAFLCGKILKFHFCTKTLVQDFKEYSSKLADGVIVVAEEDAV